MDGAIEQALAGYVEQYAVGLLKFTLAAFLAEQPARSPLTTSPPDEVIEIDERGKVHPPSAGPLLAKARERGASGAEGG